MATDTATNELEKQVGSGMSEVRGALEEDGVARIVEVDDQAVPFRLSLVDMCLSAASSVIINPVKLAEERDEGRSVWATGGKESSEALRIS
jgi:hypothetical protein